jgi:hypothetical protein
MSAHVQELELLPDDGESLSSPLLAERILEEVEVSASEKNALSVFEQVDLGRKGFLPQDYFEILLDLLGMRMSFGVTLNRSFLKQTISS